MWICYQFLCLFQACYPISCLLGRTVSVYLLPRHSCRQALNLGRKSKATKESTSKHSPLFTKMRKNVCFVKNDLQNSPFILGQNLVFLVRRCLKWLLFESPDQSFYLASVAVDKWRRSKQREFRARFLSARAAAFPPPRPRTLLRLLLLSFLASVAAVARTCTRTCWTCCCSCSCDHLVYLAQGLAQHDANQLKWRTNKLEEQ